MRIPRARAPSPGTPRDVTSSRGSAPVAVSPGARVLVQLAAQMQALEHELEGGGGAGGVARAELLQRRLQRAHLGDLAQVLRRVQRVRDTNAQTAMKRRNGRVQLATGQAPGEDVENRLLHELAEHLVLGFVAE